MKSIKLLITILSIICVGIMAILIVLIFLRGNTSSNVEIYNDNVAQVTNTYNGIEQNTNIENVIEDNDTAPEWVIDTSLININSFQILYNISNNINKYFNYIKIGNIEAINELGGNEIYNISNEVKYKIIKAYSTENEYQVKYYTYGILEIANDDNTTTGQAVYNILHVKDNYYTIETINEQEYINRQPLEDDEEINIYEGNYNIYEYENIDAVKKIEIYLADFSYELNNNIQNAYELLDEEYREKRFGGIEEFLNYANNKREQLQNIEITQYNIINKDNETIYIGTDKYGNYYKIIETGYMEYSIILDSYTMKDYSDDSDEEKIKNYAEKFILMLNSCDYKHAYNLLEKEFREENFPTQQEFEEYIKQNFFDRNIIASKELNENGICLVTIKEELSTKSNKLQKQFRINLIDDENYTIEFNL